MENLENKVDQTVPAESIPELTDNAAEMVQPETTTAPVEAEAVAQNDAPAGNETEQPVDPGTVILESNLEPEPDEAEEEHAAEDNVIASLGMEVSLADYSVLTKFELVQKFKQLISEGSAAQLKIDVENIRSSFYRRHKAENEEKRKKYLEDGGKMEEWSAPEDAQELEFKELYKSYRDEKAVLQKKIEAEKQVHLATKLAIIEEIKKLVNQPEALNKTFEEFRDCQRRWRETGLVPQKEMRALYEGYDFAVQSFYNWVKLNNEARDIDLKRNFDAKVELCEKAESLILESDVRKAFGELQFLHERWREAGPVNEDKKAELWDRFREATTKIHKAHQDFFLAAKEEQEGNYNAKTILCEKAEELAAATYQKHKEWEAKTNELIELQKVWKTLGPVPRHQSQKIFRRFKEACDLFFANKKEFYQANMEVETNNLQLKTDLCIQAESLKESTDWKQTTDALIRLQQEWKNIGPVPRRHSDRVWKRFRAACNEFFEKKNKHYASLDGMLDDNFKKKEELVIRIEEFKSTGNTEEDLNALKLFQKEWMETGHVPNAKKIAIQDRYRKAIQKQFDQLSLDDKQKDGLKFKLKIESLSQQPNPKDKLREERDFLVRKMQRIESDVKVWENNIGFFGKSKNAEILLKDFQKKIEEGKAAIIAIRDQIKMIDKLNPR